MQFEFGREVERRERSGGGCEDGRIDAQEHRLALGDDLRMSGDEILGEHARDGDVGDRGHALALNLFGKAAKRRTTLLGKCHGRAEKHDPTDLRAVTRGHRQRHEAAEAVAEDVRLR